MNGVKKRGMTGTKGNQISKTESDFSTWNVKVRKNLNSFLLTEQNLVFNNKNFGPSIIMLHNSKNNLKRRRQNQVLSQSVQSKQQIDQLPPLSQLNMNKQQDFLYNRSLSSTALNKFIDKRMTQKPFTIRKKSDQIDQLVSNLKTNDKKRLKIYMEFIQLLADQDPERVIKTMSYALAAVQKS